MSYVIAAWALTVLLLGGYAFSVYQRRRTIEREIAGLEAELASTEARSETSAAPPVEASSE